jgi:hypothetical protein
MAPLREATTLQPRTKVEIHQFDVLMFHDIRVDELAFSFPSHRLNQSKN